MQTYERRFSSSENIVENNSFESISGLDSEKNYSGEKSITGLSTACRIPGGWRFLGTVAVRRRSPLVL